MVLIQTGKRLLRFRRKQQKIQIELFSVIDLQTKLF